MKADLVDWKVWGIDRGAELPGLVANPIWSALPEEFPPASAIPAPYPDNGPRVEGLVDVDGVGVDRVLELEVDEVAGVHLVLRAVLQVDKISPVAGVEFTAWTLTKKK